MRGVLEARRRSVCGSATFAKRPITRGFSGCEPSRWCASFLRMSEEHQPTDMAAGILLGNMVGKLHDLVEIGAVVAAATWAARGDVCTLTVRHDRSTSVRFNDECPATIPDSILDEVRRSMRRQPPNA